MNAWMKVPPELATRFDAALPAAADVQRRQMFGCPCAFVNGNMFAGLHEDRLIVRLPDEAPRRPCVILGRTMKQYALFPDPLSLAPHALAQWVRRGYEYTRALPPKAPKAAKTRAPAKVAKAVKPSLAAKAMKAAGDAKAAPTAKKRPPPAVAKRIKAPR
jgi:TfoX/Sxy family transcriptional regulator of competence genes